MPGRGIQYFASGSSGRLSTAQIARLKEWGIPEENIIRGPGHAEENIVNSLPEGAVQLRWGIAWGPHDKAVPCSPRCAKLVTGTVAGT
jgi:hypothetical protein